jgi:hypothetical protein
LLNVGRDYTITLEFGKRRTAYKTGRLLRKKARPSPIPQERLKESYPQALVGASLNDVQKETVQALHTDLLALAEQGAALAAEGAAGTKVT